MHSAWSGRILTWVHGNCRVTWPGSGRVTRIECSGASISIHLCGTGNRTLLPASSAQHCRVFFGNPADLFHLVEQEGAHELARRARAHVAPAVAPAASTADWTTSRDATPDDIVAQTPSPGPDDAQFRQRQLARSPLITPTAMSVPEDAPIVRTSRTAVSIAGMAALQMAQSRLDTASPAAPSAAVTRPARLMSLVENRATDRKSVG